MLPPHVGLLWTPGYWGWSGGEYVWNAGYWGPTVGFYGGICYGFGYTGVGYAGGYWSGNSFYYNRSVTNISTTTVINTVYHQEVINNSIPQVSYNGGHDGVRARPTARELQAASEQRIAPTQDQLRHQTLASSNPDLRASMNQGKPGIAAVARAGELSHGVIAAQAAGGHFRPVSLPAGNALNGPHPGARNQAGAGNALAAKNHADPNPRSNGAAGPRRLDASQGPTRNAVSNVNPGMNDRAKGPGASASRGYVASFPPNGGPARMNGAPPLHANGAPMRMNGMPPLHANGGPMPMNGAPMRGNGVPTQMNGAPPKGAAMMKAPGSSGPRMQQPAGMPRPAAPHPAAPQQKKDQHHG